MNHNLVPDALATRSQLLLVAHSIIRSIDTRYNDIVAADANNLKHRILIFLHIRNHF